MIQSFAILIALSQAGVLVSSRQLLCFVFCQEPNNQSGFCLVLYTVVLSNIRIKALTIKNCIILLINFQFHRDSVSFGCCLRVMSHPGLIKQNQPTIDCSQKYIQGVLKHITTCVVVVELQLDGTRVYCYIFFVVILFSGLTNPHSST